MDADTFDSSSELTDLNFLNVSELRIFIPQSPIFNEFYDDGLLTIDESVESEPTGRHSTPSLLLSRNNVNSFDSDHSSAVSSSEQERAEHPIQHNPCRRYIKIERFNTDSRGRVIPPVTGILDKEQEFLQLVRFTIHIRVLDLIDRNFPSQYPADKQVLLEHYTKSIYNWKRNTSIIADSSLSQLQREIDSIQREIEECIRLALGCSKELPQWSPITPHMYIPVRTKHNWDEMREMCSKIISSTSSIDPSSSLHIRLTNMLIELILGGIPFTESFIKYCIDIEQHSNLLNTAAVSLLSDPECHEIIKSRNCVYLDGHGVLLVDDRLQ